MPPRMKNSSFANRLSAAVRNDPKKACVLTVLVVVLGVLQVRLVMRPNAGPDFATAAPRQSSSGTPDNGSPLRLSPSGDASTGAARPGSGGSALRAWADAPTGQLGRNLFAINYDEFSQDIGRVNNNPAVANDGFWD